MSPSPIERVLEACARSDVDGVAALFAPRGRLLIIDGRRAEGAAEVKDLVASVLEDLRSITYELSDQWSVDGVWIAELEGSYERSDGSRVSHLPRAVVLRESDAGITDLHFYGAHEPRLDEYPRGDEGLMLEARWMPSL